MTKPAGTLTDATLSVGRLAGTAGAVRVRHDVKYDVVRVGGVRHALNALELIEAEGISDPPRHHVVGAGGVTADADATHFDATPVKRKTAANTFTPPTRWPTMGSFGVPNEAPAERPWVKLAWLRLGVLAGGWLP
jgi:hypothetical protein